MKRSFFCALFILAAVAVFAEDDEVVTAVTEEHHNSGFRKRALALNIEARVLEDNQTVVWNETHRRIAIPGSPVGLQLVGSNIVVSVQFTPFIRRSGNVLVAQGQIWISDPEKGMSYYTSIQTIPMEFGEPIYFYPLGDSRQPDSSIQIILTVNPNNPADIPPPPPGRGRTVVNTGNND
jgi:hypothetical protein